MHLAGELNICCWEGWRRQPLRVTIIRIHCFFRQLAWQIHCSSARLGLNAGRMPPKGVKAALPAVRGKQAKLSAICRSDDSDELKLQHKVKRGALEKVNVKLKSVPLDTLERKSRD
ncbi:hypothetical protein NDU88_007515 [Pleurodeles waltl]|uniref:Uncharacterized protein n=1 Tax=Pleurodeles waltl TaxID=8319 RepID=A0AAV7RT96_PLEWA|nr:hypothetical protein NDU88_007515 [Pleurodeles waltl]